MRAGHFLTFAALAAVAGCSGGGECQQDLDCSGGDVCANTHECLSSSSVRRVDIRWTLYGSAPSQASCLPIDRMELTVTDSTSDAIATYAPVPCATGRFLFDKLPIGFDTVALSAVVGGTIAESEQGTVDGSGVVTFDFSQGFIGDAGVPSADASPPIDAP